MTPKFNLRCILSTQLTRQIAALRTAEQKEDRFTGRCANSGLSADPGFGQPLGWSRGDPSFALGHCKIRSLAPVITIGWDLLR